jgi:proteasome lid subunit RPN8/RPN11
MLNLPESSRLEIVAHALDSLPFEACGLLVGRRLDADSNDAAVQRFVPTENEAKSAKVYTVPGVALLRAERAAEDEGLEVLGVVHSHTHTEAYPSPTDVRQAPDPSWHYVIVSLKDGGTAMRSFRMIDARIAEEPISVISG